MYPNVREERFSDWDMHTWIISIPLYEWNLVEKYCGLFYFKTIYMGEKMLVLVSG